MVRIVSPEWVADRLSDPAFAVADPRRPMKYLSGHLPGAINVPMYKAFGADGRLLAPDDLAAFLAAAGLGDSRAPILYDSPEGQNAAMLAWILEYLGRSDVYVMGAFFEWWKSSGREVLYKPVEAPAAHFTAKPNASIRVAVEELRDGLSGAGLVDFRSGEEFSGEKAMGGDAPGHIPGAVNFPWRDLGTAPERLLKSREELQRTLAGAGIAAGGRIVAYCRSGPRAALGYLALRELGYDVRLFDGSWAEWSRAGLPTEKSVAPPR
jgi:thiosulfate/3-mercaptopyruvate sulfurtransferase